MSRSEFFRWAGCAVVVVAAHALVALAFAPRPDDASLEAGAPVVMIELAPMSVAPPAPPADLAPGPQQVEAESQERAAEQTPPEHRQTEEKREDMPAPDPTIALPPPVPEPAIRPEEAKAEPEPKEAAPVPTAPPSVTVPDERPAAPAPGRVSRPSSQAVVSWQRLLMAHLERYKRYPTQAHGERGTASVAFTIDREGRVSGVRIVRSSGSAVLDGETLAMIRRAQPLPVPPGGIADQQLSFIVPIRYAASR